MFVVTFQYTFLCIDWWGTTLVPKILDQSDRVGAKSSIFARSASAVTPVWKLSETNLQGIHWPNYPCKNGCWEATPSAWNF